MLTFNDGEIVKLFGFEAAEEEERQLDAYYLQTKYYNKLSEDIPLRIVIGSKGIGKTALLLYSKKREHERGALTIFLRPDDILVTMDNSSDINELIKRYKILLKDVIFRESLDFFKIKDANSNTEKLEKSARIIGKGVFWLTEVLKPVVKPYVDKDTMVASIFQRVLDGSKAYVYIDELDRGWDGSELQRIKLSALLYAIRDLSKDICDIRFHVALRTDVYNIIRSRDESIDKLEYAIISIEWSNLEILAILVKRINTFINEKISDNELMGLKIEKLAEKLNPVIAPLFNIKGKWENQPVYEILLRMIRQRPRDLIKLCSMAARSANQYRNPIIKAENFQSVFEKYSVNRLDDMIVEYKSELPEIRRLLLGMRESTPERKLKKKNPFIYNSNEELETKIKNIIEQGQFLLYNSPANALQLGKFLYRIEFLKARMASKSGRHTRIITIAENKNIYDEERNFGAKWEIHPAFRWALKPEEEHNIIDTL